MQEDAQALIDRIIREARLTPLFQPIVALGRDAVHGYEALIRGPEGSSLHSPVKLFDLAMRHHRLVDLDLLCRRLAIERFVQLDLPGRLFLNVMPPTMLGRDFRAGLTLGYLEQAGLSSSRVVIELTEHVPIHDYALMRQAVAHYRSMGFQVALDDLGAGYSSLRHWSELRPDFVKLDRHFVSGIDEDPNKREFLRSIIDVARGLDCRLIAEGIETEEEHRCLWELDRGACLVQGFYLGRPCETPPRVIEHVLPASHVMVDDFAPGARRLARSVTPASPATPVPEVVERLRGNPALRCLPLVEDAQPVGVVRRNDFLTLFTNRYSLSLLERRPVSDVADTQMLLVSEDMPLSELSEQITRSERAPEDFVVVDAAGRYLGMGNILDLLREITTLQVRQARHANPLTGLPGNILINEQVSRRLGSGKAFVAVYCDLDNFKAFNDSYGYARGDRLIVTLARLLVEEVGSENFVGHIGGDDFMLLVAPENWYALCRRILSAFAVMAPTFYDAADRLAGGVWVENRQGEKLFCPFVSLSLAARPVAGGARTSALDLAADLSELKKQAKRQPGNSLFVDRRRARVPARLRVRSREQTVPC